MHVGKEHIIEATSCRLRAAHQSRSRMCGRESCVALGCIVSMHTIVSGIQSLSAGSAPEAAAAVAGSSSCRLVQLLMQGGAWRCSVQLELALLEL